VTVQNGDLAIISDGIDWGFTRMGVTIRVKQLVTVSWGMVSVICYSLPLKIAIEIVDLPS
jgi:hypothetical protein